MFSCLRMKENSIESHPSKRLLRNAETAIKSTSANVVLLGNTVQCL